MSDKTCGTCTFWIKQPADPMNLGAPAVGQCRHGPPQIVALSQFTISPAGQPSIVNQLQAMFPVVPLAHPACGQYQAAASVVH